MLLKHRMKFIATEITELVKITKQETGALATTKNENLMKCCYYSLTAWTPLFCFHMFKIHTSGNLNNTEVCYDIRCD